MSGRGSVTADEETEEDFELELGDENEEDDSEDTSSGTDTSQTQPVVTSDYEERFKGLQGTVQAYSEQNRQLQTQLLAIQAQNAHAQLMASGKSKEEADSILQAVLTQYAMQMQGSSYQTKEQALEQAARGVTAQALAVQHGFALNSPEFARIAKVKDPEDMAAMAETLAEKRSTAAKSDKNAKRPVNADKFGSGRSSGSAPKTKPKSLGDAADRFSKIKIEM